MRTPTIARVMNTDEAAHRKRIPSITRSRARSLRRRCAFSRVAIVVSGCDAGEPRVPRESFGCASTLRFPLHEVVDRDADLRDAAEDRACPALVELLEDSPIGVLGQRQVLNLLDER